MGALPMIPKLNGKAAFDQSPSTESSFGAINMRFSGTMKELSFFMILIPKVASASSVIFI